MLNQQGDDNISNSKSSLSERELYWKELLNKYKTSDSRLRELVLRDRYKRLGWRNHDQEELKKRKLDGLSREDLEVMAAKRLAVYEEHINESKYGDGSDENNKDARSFWVSTLRDDIKELSWEEEQADRKDRYYYEQECRNCRRVFYSKTERALYCCEKCDNEYFVKQRKERKEVLRSHRVCLYCHKQFAAARTDAKYCCDSHRVRFCQEKQACLARQRR
jgi:hypothetical protein